MNKFEALPQGFIIASIAGDFTIPTMPSSVSNSINGTRKGQYGACNPAAFSRGGYNDGNSVIRISRNKGPLPDFF